MKLILIEKAHLLKAAAEMDSVGDNSWAEYWIKFENGKEYQFKHLLKRAYELGTGESISNESFTSSLSYRSFISKKFGLSIICKVPGSIPFFTPSSLKFFSQFAGTQYRKANTTHVAAGKRIRLEIFKKTNVWADLLDLPDWHHDPDNIWQISGSFKPYSWIRIFKPQDRNAKVFFTIGVHGEEEELCFKLDC